MIIDQHGNNLPGYHLDERLIDAGCILVRPNASNCQIRCDPVHMSTDALAALEEALNTLSPQRIHFKWPTHQWPEEIHGSTKSALERLITLMSSVPRTRFLDRQRRELANDDPLQAIVSLWKQTGGCIDMRQHSDYITRHTDKFLTAYLDDGTVRFGQLGPGWVIYKSKNWLTHCISQRVEDQPDIAYGTWVSGIYADQMDMTEPYAMDCDALVMDPTGDGKKNLRYTRLTLPIIGIDGRRHLLSTSRNEPSAGFRSPVC